MDAYEVARIIEEIGDTSSRGEKEKLIKALAGSEIGAFILHWTYNPFITFGVTAAPTESETGRFEFRPSLVEPLLKKLASRELTGHAADREIAEVMQVLNKDGARLLFLILSKDLKCGVAETTINAAVPGTIPVFSVQRAHTYEPKRLKPGKTYKGEFKLDGQRNTFLCHNGNGGFFTRSGKRVPSLDFMVPTIIKVAAYAAQVGSEELRKILLGDRPCAVANLNFMLDGEAMMGLFEDTGALRRKNEDAVGAELHLYDFLSYEDFDTVGPAGDVLAERRKRLSEFFMHAKLFLASSATPDIIQVVPQFFVNNDDEVQALFQTARSMTLAKYLARGDAAKEAALEKTLIDKATGKPKVLEGVVIKDMDALYEKKKSYAWMKLKSEETLDLRVISAFPGEPHTKYQHCLGGLVVDHNGVEVRVGGGFTDAEREALWPLFQADLSKTLLPGVTGELLGRLIEVEFTEVTPDGSLRHPRFVRFRDDKDGEVEEKIAA